MKIKMKDIQNKANTNSPFRLRRERSTELTPKSQSNGRLCYIFVYPLRGTDFGDFYFLLIYIPYGK